MFLTLITSLFGGFVSLMIYIYYLKKGQFEDEEELKYQIFREDE